MSSSDEIVAAGGLLLEWSKDSGKNSEPRVLLVHRPKYDDWSFPKGKLDPGETIEEAALREVEEETGLRCRILRPLEPLRYQYRDRSNILRPKVVHYFLMEVEGGKVSVNMYEIDEAGWYPTSDALNRLRYQHDRELLSLTLSQMKE
jgi:8-oxo-dGTP diphosphatase